jgi:hypothetical protein
MVKVDVEGSGLCGAIVLLRVGGVEIDEDHHPVSGGNSADRPAVLLELLLEVGPVRIRKTLLPKQQGVEPMVGIDPSTRLRSSDANS